MLDNLQLLVLSSITIQLWMFRVAAALLWGCSQLSGGGRGDSLLAALPAVSSALHLYGSQRREPQKEGVSLSL